MKIEKKLDILKMRLEGATYDEIASELGVSRQYVYQSIKAISAEIAHPRVKCIFPGIASFMIQKDKTERWFAQQLNVRVETVRGWFRGSRKPKIDIIQRMLKLTGLTYEQAFGERKEDAIEEVSE